MGREMCRHNLDNCQYDGTTKCNTCYTGQYYREAVHKPRKGLAPRARNQRDNRQGSQFEAANHKYNQDNIVSNLTNNSGATRWEKGDENIEGLVRVMQELKTQDPGRKGGTKSFSIKREWLDKLTQEARERDFEFWYLLFSFAEDQGTAGEVYAVVDREVLTEMVTALARSRHQVKAADAKVALAEARYQTKVAELSLERAKNLELMAQMKLTEVEKDDT